MRRRAYWYIGVRLRDFSALLNYSNSLPRSSQNRILKVGARIGKGASASVFRAIDSVTLKIVALKEISISEPLKCKMLQEELKALMPQRRR